MGQKRRRRFLRLGSGRVPRSKICEEHAAMAIGDGSEQPIVQTHTPSDPAAAARLLMRRARIAALATLELGSGHPYASLVAVATEPDGTPLLLISRLALHTRSVGADARASLLFEERNEAATDPLAGGRLTMMGELRPTQSRTARARFLARHRTAESYVGFSDFAFYALAAARGHFVGGFGRIVDLNRASLIL